MNRVIKFRAWITSERTMIQHREVIERAHLQFEDSLNDTDLVMQFTGLTDKNGKEIYEGDITNDFSNVIFNNGCFMTTYRGDMQGGTWLTEKRCEYLEVIGNIYENPELLKP